MTDNVWRGSAYYSDEACAQVVVQTPTAHNCTVVLDKARFPVEAAMALCEAVTAYYGCEFTEGEYDQLADDLDAAFKAFCKAKTALRQNNETDR